MSHTSPAYTLMRAAVSASRSTSWRQINPQRAQMLNWMIGARVTFEPDDMALISHDFAGSHWFPDVDDMLRLACASSNRSAIVSISESARRPVWKWIPNVWESVPSAVLHVRAKIVLDDNERHEITSFGIDGRTLIACTYYPFEPDKPTRVKSRRTLTFDEAAEITKARRAALRAAKKGAPPTYDALFALCEQATDLQAYDPRRPARDVLSSVLATIRAMPDPEPRLIDLAASLEAHLQGTPA